MGNPKEQAVIVSNETTMTTYERLAKRFPPEAHKKRKQGSAELTYVTGEMVISRLNEVLGLAGWSFRVLREGSSEVEAWVLGEMVVTIDGATITRQQYGNQDVMRGSRATSDLFKSAATDALKKCATTIGVGLYLYDEDERREVEQEMREAARQPQRKAAAPTPINNNVRDAAVLTGAAPGVDARVESIKKLQTVMKMAMAEGIEFNDVNPAEMPDEEILSFGKLLADSVRAARAAKKAS